MRFNLIDTYFGIIWDADPGSVQIIICREGLLGLHVPLLNRALFASRYVRGGAPIRLNGAQLATREERRLYSLLHEHTIDELAAAEPDNVLIRRASLGGWSLHYRVTGTSLYLDSVNDTPRRIYRWTPSMNRLPPVRTCLQAAYRDGNLPVLPATHPHRRWTSGWRGRSVLRQTVQIGVFSVVAWTR